MIEVYSGFPGSGKTFACTYRAYKAMKNGDIVFTNYPLKGAHKITFDDLINYTFPVGSTVIIDEAGRWFNSRKWSSLPEQVFDLFTLHRHMKLDLIVAVQNFNRIDKALREVIELVWWSRNIPGLPFFIYEGYYDVEMMGLKGEHDKQSIIWRWARSRKLYDTHAMKNTVQSDLIPLSPWFEPKLRIPLWTRLKNVLLKRIGGSGSRGVRGADPSELERQQGEEESFASSLL